MRSRKWGDPSTHALDFYYNTFDGDRAQLSNLYVGITNHLELVRRELAD